MATTWSREEILKLIEVWGEDNVQAQLNSCKRNQEVFAKVSTVLLEAGHNKTSSQCRDKIKKLKAEYRKVKDKREKTGEGRYPEWDYFDALDAILGHRPATKPPLVINSISAVGPTAIGPSEDLDDEENPQTPDNLNDDTPCTSETSHSQKTTSVSPTSDSEVASLKQPRSSRKRKRPNSVVEKVEGVTSAIITVKSHHVN